MSLNQIGSFLIGAGRQQLAHGNIDKAIVTLYRDQSGDWRYLYSGKVFPLSYRVREMAESYQAVIKLQKENKSDA